MASYENGLLPSAIVTIRQKNTLPLSQKLISILNIGPGCNVRVTFNQEGVATITKVGGAIEKTDGRSRIGVMTSILLVDVSGRIRITGTLCNLLGMQVGSQVIIYLDEPNQRLILQRYNPITIAEDLFERLDGLLTELTHEEASAAYYAALHHLREAKKLVVPSQPRRKKCANS